MRLRTKGTKKSIVGVNEPSPVTVALRRSAFVFFAVSLGSNSASSEYARHALGPAPSSRPRGAACSLLGQFDFLGIIERFIREAMGFYDGLLLLVDLFPSSHPADNSCGLVLRRIGPLTHAEKLRLSVRTDFSTCALTLKWKI